MRKSVRLGLIVLAPVFLLLVGILFLRAGGDSRADEPVFSVASTWPPIHRNLSQTGDKYSRATDFASNGDDIVAVWSEGYTSNDSYNGLIRMAWNGVSKGEWVEKDVYIEGGFVGTAPSVVVDDNYAHFVWVSDIAGGPTRQYRVLYRKFNLNTGAWVAGGWESVYPRYTGTPVYSSDALGTPKITLDSTGTPHVVWVQTEMVGVYRDRIHYGVYSGSSWYLSAAPERITGTEPDVSAYSQDMPEITALGTDVYVAWREKSAGDTSWGIYANRRSGGSWDLAPTSSPAGYRVSTGKYDEAPTMDAAHERVYLAWDRWLDEECDVLEDNCYQVYSVTYRVHTTGSTIDTNWYPDTSTGPRDVTVNSSPIEAMAIISTPQDAQTGDPILLEPGLVPSPEGYLSGVRPSLDVIYDSGVYTPFVVWHHWANEDNDSNNVNRAQPYQIRGAYGIGTVAGAEEWEYLSEEQDGEILAMGLDGIFAAPSLVMLPGQGGVYDYHVVMNVRVSSDPVRWDVLYTNPYDFDWVFLPAIFRDYP